MQVLFYFLLFIVGACLGSFLCCQARRLHLKTLHRRFLGRRSVCLHCHCQLRWYDNLPIISWLLLRGKCRHCHKTIGLAELFSELGTGLMLVAIFFSFDQNIGSPTSLLFGVFPPQDLTSSFYTISPFNYAILVFTCLLALILAFLAIYDGLYGELPSLCLTLSIICAIIILTLRVWVSLSVSSFTPALLTEPLLATLTLGGLYLLLYLISKGRWVGDGDWLLATAIAIALGTPWLALIALFLANFLAALIMYPLTKKTKHRKIHLGPFLVAAFAITYAFSTLLGDLFGIIT